MPEVWRIEYHVIDASGETVDWLSSRSDAIAQAQKIRGSVERVTEYLNDRETIYESDPPEDEE